MLRRRIDHSTIMCPNSLKKCAPLITFCRFASHSATHHDHSSAFASPLTREESIHLDSQKHRTVSGVVPGKVFMRHWTAGEQATISIYNRAISLVVSAAIVLGATF